jgi:hypothetical protein
MSQALARCHDQAVVAQCILVIANYMDACEQTIRYFARSKILKHLRAGIDAVDNGAASDSMQILLRVGQMDLGLVAEQFGLDVILARIGRCRLAEQRRAFGLVQRVAENVFREGFARLLPALTPFFEGNPALRPFAIGTFSLSSRGRRQSRGRRSRRSRALS